jgi:hypothetical protein
MYSTNVSNHSAFLTVPDGFMTVSERFKTVFRPKTVLKRSETVNKVHAKGQERVGTLKMDALKRIVENFQDTFTFTLQERKIDWFIILVIFSVLK